MLLNSAFGRSAAAKAGVLESALFEHSHFVTQVTAQKFAPPHNSPMISLKSLPARVLRLLIGAPACLLCGSAGEADVPLCLACRRTLPWLVHRCRTCALPLEVSFDGTALLCGACLERPPPVRAAAVALHYEQPLSGMLLRFKNGGDQVVGAALGKLLQLEVLTSLLPLLAGRRPTVVPIPLHLARLRQRGFNQSLELARPLLRSTGWPVDHRLLVRVRNSPSFQGLSVARRKAEARGLFAVRTDRQVPAEVLLVDDVITTAATCFSAAKTLRDAGCERVWVAALARTDR